MSFKERFARWWKRLSGRLTIYAVILISIGVSIIVLTYLSHAGPLADANPFDVATFLIVIAGAGIALVAQEISGRVQIAGFRRLWTEQLRDLLAKFCSSISKYGHASDEQKIVLSEEVVSHASNILMMLTDLRASGNASHPHALLEAQIFRVLEKNNIKIDRDLIVSARPVLKEGWLQTVDEVRLS